jgi:hypothetical protein
VLTANGRQFHHLEKMPADYRFDDPLECADLLSVSLTIVLPVRKMPRRRSETPITNS